MGSGAQRPARASRTPDSTAPIEGYVDSLPLEAVERAFLAGLLEYAHRRGEISLDGAELEVMVPSRTMMGFCRRYWEVLPGLLAQGYVAKARGYSTYRGRCTTYRVPCLEAC